MAEDDAGTPLFPISLHPEHPSLDRSQPASSQGQEEPSLQVLAQCSRSPEAEQVYQAALSSCTACTRQLAEDLSSLLSEHLPSAGVALCSSMPSPPSSNSSSSKDWKLRHTYVTVSTGARTLIIEPHFRAHFEVPRASASYRAFVGSLPLLLVVEAQEMQPLVSAISARMACEIRSMGLPIAPWRSASMLLSRWDSTCMRQEPITHTAPASSHANRSRSSSSSSCCCSSNSSNSSSSRNSSSGADSSYDAATSSGCGSAAAPPSSQASLPAHSVSCTNTPRVVVRGFEPAPSSSSSPPPSPTPSQPAPTASTPALHPMPPSLPQPSPPAPAATTAGSDSPETAAGTQQRHSDAGPVSPRKAMLASPASSSSLATATHAASRTASSNARTAEQQPALQRPASTSSLGALTAVPRRVRNPGGMRQALQLPFGAAAPAHKPSTMWRSPAECVCVECGYTANGEKLRPIFKTRPQGNVWTARVVHA